MIKKEFVAVTWWPHSGGRWLCRSLLGKHEEIYETVFTHPWILVSTDMIMELDNTAQVHKARSLPELNLHLEALTQSINNGREKGLCDYFDYIENNYLKDKKLSKKRIFLGEMAMGSPIPRAIDIEMIFRAKPDIKLIHLVRNPIDCFQSFASRIELDGDPIKIAGSWLTLNLIIKSFFKTHQEFMDQFHLVRYEDLLNDTESVLKKICAFLSIEFDKKMLGTKDQIWGRNTPPKCPLEIADSIRDVTSKELTYYNYL